MQTRPLGSRITARGGRAFLLLFFSIFFLAGSGFAWLMFGEPMKGVLAARSWNPALCTIVWSELQSHSSSDGTTYSVGVRYRYMVDGVTYEEDRYKFMRGSSSGRAGKLAIVQSLPRGARVTCWVNPAQPDDAVIERGLTADMWFVLLPLLFVVIGAGGLYATATGRGFARGLATLDGAASVVPQPAPAGPATLAPRQSRKAAFFGLVFFAIFWNAIVSVFVVQMVRSWGTGGFSWFMALFMIPFVVAGVIVVGAAVSRGLALANPQPVLTVSASTIPLGDELKVDWLIEGKVERLTGFRIELEGREEARYRRGTSTYTDRSVFLRRVVAQAAAPVPAVGSERIRVPADSMHSFEARNNKIIWAVRVKGEIPNWPDLDDEFALTVLPVR